MVGKALPVNSNESLNIFVERAVSDILGHAMKGNTGDKVYRVLAIKIKKYLVDLISYPVDMGKLKKVLG